MTDPHNGLGGSYIIDPETGERKLVDRTDADAKAAPEETTQTEQPAEPVAKGRKGK